MRKNERVKGIEPSSHAWEAGSVIKLKSLSDDENVYSDPIIALDSHLNCIPKYQSCFSSIEVGSVFLKFRFQILNAWQATL